MIVYVRNKDGKPLMPTRRCGHVRKLLRDGKACVYSRKPFTIQLTYKTEDIVQHLYGGIDPGRTNIGVAVVKENGQPIMSVQVTTRNKEIPKLMEERKANRNKHRDNGRRDVKQRRAKAAGTVAGEEIIPRLLPGCEEPIECHYIKNKVARFNNRKRKDGWLTPTARQLLQTHINILRMLMQYVPISHIALEINKFAFMALDDPHVRRWQYQRGPLFNTGGLHEAVSEQQEHHCLLCSRDIDHYHHVVPRHKGGSNTLPNIVGLCTKHHHLVHTNEEIAAKITTVKEGMNKKYGALSVLNQIISYLVDELSEMFPGSVYVTDGYSTKLFRDKHNVPKDHDLDAYCIACSVLPEDITVQPNSKYYHVKQFRRHDRQACNNEMLKRKYYLDGKLVATNRHKACEQTEDSLEDFRATHSEQDVSRLTVKEHRATYKDMNRPMPGSMFRHNGNIFILQGSQGRENGKPSYYIDTHGNKHRANKCTVIKRNTGLVFL